MLFQNYPDEFKKSLEKLYIEDFPEDLENYKIVEEELVRRSDIELIEIQMYGRVLTEEERILNTLKPSYAELKKAENTIELLSVLQEVLQ